MKKLVMAPTQLRERVLRLIERERERAEAGQPAADPGQDELAGGRGHHPRALRRGPRRRQDPAQRPRHLLPAPGPQGRRATTIEVVSIVDRFLEHARIFYFRNGGDEEVYLSSADWMPRNLDRRIELLFPVAVARGAAEGARARSTPPSPTTSRRAGCSPTAPTSGASPRAGRSRSAPSSSSSARPSARSSAPAPASPSPSSRSARPTEPWTRPTQSLEEVVQREVRRRRHRGRERDREHPGPDDPPRDAPLHGRERASSRRRRRWRR